MSMLQSPKSTGWISRQFGFSADLPSRHAAVTFNEVYDVAEELLTTKEAAAILGVGTTSVKRWADSGVLRCVKTPGGHRRFPRQAVEALIGQPEPVVSTSTGRISDWVSSLTSNVSGAQLVEALRAEHREHGSWFSVVTTLVPVVEEIGRGWARGELSVIQEHIASERLTRGLARCSDGIVVPPGAPSCLLIAAERDEHLLGLSMVEVCLREFGWRTTWAGRGTPIHFACEFISSSNVDMVAVSASQNSRDRELLADQADRLGAVCAQRGIPLLLGGLGLWPTDPVYGHRVRTFEQLAILLRGPLRIKEDGRIQA